MGGEERLETALALLAEAARECVATAVRMESDDHARRALHLALICRQALHSGEQLLAQLENGRDADRRAAERDGQAGHDWTGHVVLLPPVAEGPPAGAGSVPAQGRSR